MKLFFCQNDPLMGEPFWQNNSLVSLILFELQPIIIFSPVANFGNQSLICMSSRLLTPFGEGFSFDDISLLVGLGLGILALVTGLGLDLVVGVMGGHDGLQKPQLP